MCWLSLWFGGSCCFIGVAAFPHPQPDSPLSSWYAVLFSSSLGIHPVLAGAPDSLLHPLRQLPTQMWRQGWDSCMQSLRGWLLQEVKERSRHSCQDWMDTQRGKEQQSMPAGKWKIQLGSGVETCSTCGATPTKKYKSLNRGLCLYLKHEDRCDVLCMHLPTRAILAFPVNKPIRLGLN